MSLVSKLWKSRVYNENWSIADYDSAVADLVKLIESGAKRKGLTVSRWQNNSNTHGFVKGITWAVHEGPRPSYSRDLPSDAHVVHLSNIEGTTKRSDAYNKLYQLLEAVR